MTYGSADDAREGLRMLAIERSLADAGVRLSVGSDVLIQAGLDALLVGVDAPSLRLLAGLGRSEEPLARELFDAAVAELSLSTDLPSDQTSARWALVQWWARLVVGREIAPHDGGRLISNEWASLESPPSLLPIIGWTSEWDDWREDWGTPREHYDEKVAQACREFLASRLLGGPAGNGVNSENEHDEESGDFSASNRCAES